MKTTRRSFLAATSAAPLIMNAQDKAGTKAPVLGEGAHKYEAIHDWGELPSHIKWGNTHGVVEDSQGNIHVHHTVNKESQSADTMVVFDSKGKFVRSWGKEFRGVAHGLHLQKEGREEFLYLSVNAANPRMTPQPEMQAVVLKTNLKGEVVWKIQGPPDVPQYKPGADGAPKRYSPTNLAIAPNGDVYVGDGYGSWFINQYNKKGEHIRTFGGGGGAEPGQIREPHGIWIDARGKAPVVVVADRGNSRLQRFTLDGKHVDFTTGLRKPCHLHEHKGDVVIPDLYGRVTVMDRNNQLVAQLGDSGLATGNSPLRTQPRDKFIPGQFMCPHGACFDHSGNIFVVEWVEVGRVTKLRKVA
jgi:hypothetical protein